MKVEAQVTSYSVRGDKVEEEVVTQAFELKEMVDSHGEKWIIFVHGPQGIRTSRIPEAIDRGGWYAQAGTKPVYVPPCPHPEDAPSCCGRTCEAPNGGWGGRNYPEIFVNVDQLQRVQEELSKEGE